MLKIKDNIDLKRLENHGFEYGKYMIYPKYYERRMPRPKICYIKTPKLPTLRASLLYTVVINDKREIVVDVESNFGGNVIRYGENKVVKSFIKDLIDLEYVERVKEKNSDRI